MDLSNLLGTQHVDHVLSDKFTHLPDAGEAFNHDGIYRFLRGEIIEIPDRDFINHFLPSSGIFHICLQEKNVQGAQ
jgi:hypothetical protein